jgi:hypothetical protein
MALGSGRWALNVPPWPLVNPVGRSSFWGGDRRKAAWMLGFSRKRTNLHEKYDYPDKDTSWFRSKN